MNLVVVLVGKDSSVGDEDTGETHDPLEGTSGTSQQRDGGQIDIEDMTLEDVTDEELILTATPSQSTRGMLEHGIDQEVGRGFRK